MPWLIAKRLAAIVPLLLLVSMGTFLMANLMRGDPARALAGDAATEQQIAQVREELHLDDPLPARYVRWLGDVTRGDLGESVATRRPVSDEIARRWPVTASLAVSSLVLAIIVGVPLGIIQGMRPGSRIDKALLGVVSLGLATPNFLLGTMLVFGLAVQRRWLPALGYVPFAESPLEWARHLLLPATTLAVVGAAEIARQLRTGLVDVAQADYIRAARARGLSGARVAVKHSLKNAAMPALTIMGLRFGHLLAGSVIVEQIFQFPGLGHYALQAIQNRDFTVLQSVVLALGVIIILTNLVVDIVYAWLNPKVRLS